MNAPIVDALTPELSDTEAWALIAGAEHVWLSVEDGPSRKMTLAKTAFRAGAASHAAQTEITGDPQVDTSYTGQIATLLAENAALRKDAERYWPFVEMIAHRRPPTSQDEFDAVLLERERKFAAIYAATGGKVEGERSTGEVAPNGAAVAPVMSRSTSPTPPPAVAPEPVALTFTAPEAVALLATFGGDAGEVTVRQLPEGAIKPDDGDMAEGPSPAGLYAHMTDYPEEGCVYLGASDPDAAPPAAEPTEEYKRGFADGVERGVRQGSEHNG